MKPLFEVGEEVILCSEGYPEFNGDAVIVEVLGGIFYDRFNGEPREGFGYILNRDTPEGTSWRETSLRKKYKGVDFNQMMKDIRQNKPVEA